MLANCEASNTAESPRRVWQFEASKGDPPEQTCRAKKRGRLKAGNHRDSDIQDV